MVNSYTRNYETSNRKYCIRNCIGCMRCVSVCSLPSINWMRYGSTLLLKHNNNDILYWGRLPSQLPNSLLRSCWYGRGSCIFFTSDSISRNLSSICSLSFVISSIRLQTYTFYLTPPNRPTIFLEKNVFTEIELNFLIKWARKSCSLEVFRTWGKATKLNSFKICRAREVLCDGYFMRICMRHHWQ